MRVFSFRKEGIHLPVDYTLELPSQIGTLHTATYIIRNYIEIIIIQRLSLHISLDMMFFQKTKIKNGYTPSILRVGNYNLLVKIKSPCKVQRKLKM